MQIEWINAIVAAVCSLLGVFGGGGILYLKYNKQLKAIEVTHNQADEWKRLYDEKDNESKKKDSTIEALNCKIDKLYTERNDASKRESSLELKNQQLCWYYCTINGCKRRTPPHNYDVNGQEYKANEEDIEKSLI